MRQSVANASQRNPRRPMDSRVRTAQDADMAGGWRASFKDRRAYRVAARLTLLLFALRALLPVGYMPDVRALERGQVQIVICTGYGAKSLLVDEAGQPVEGQGAGKAQHDGAADCPFGMASAKAFLAAAAAPTLDLPVLGDGFLPPAGALALLPPAQGPPLGQRAPPVLLG